MTEPKTLTTIIADVTADANDLRDRVAEKRLSDTTRMALVVAQIEDALLKLPVNIAFGALATLAGRLVVASHRTDPDKRRNNRHTFVHTVDTVIRLEEQKQDTEARIRARVEGIVAAQQRKDPLTTPNKKAIELEVRARFRKADELFEEKPHGNA